MTRMSGLALMIALFSWPALGETAGLPSLATLAKDAAARYPQPVRVGDLIGRDLLQPEESQPVLGRVQSLDRRADGGVDVIVREGTVLGWGGRPVAVPIEAVALLGEHVALLGYTPAQLASLPTATVGTLVPPDTTIPVGLVKPFH